MKRLLVCGRLDGESQSLEHLRQLSLHEQPDAVLVAGLWGGSRNVDRELSVHQKDFYCDVFRAAKQAGRPTILLPGEHDVPFSDFIRLVMAAEKDDRHLHCVHATPYVEGGVCFVGVGGDLNEFIDTWNDRLRSSRSAVEYYLRQFNRHPIARLVVMLTTPTTGPSGSGSPSELAGDVVLARDVISWCRPALAVVAGETHCRGVNRVADTRIINPGRLSDGSAAVIDLDDPDKVHFPQPAVAAAHPIADVEEAQAGSLN